MLQGSQHGTGWLTSNIGSSYPFKELSDLTRVVADGYVYAPVEPCAIRIDSMSDPRVAGCAITLVGGWGTLTMSAPTTVDVGEWRHMRWVHTVDAHTIYRVMLVLHIPALDEITWPHAGANEFAPRALGFPIPQLVTAGVDAVAMDGKIELTSGNNVNITASGQDVTISAKAGAGEGYGYSEADRYISSIASTLPDTGGRFALSAEDCLMIVPDPDTHSIQIYNNCRPCNDCADYGTVYEKGLRAIYERGVIIRDLLIAWKTKYTDILAVLAARRADNDGIAVGVLVLKDMQEGCAVFTVAVQNNTHKKITKLEYFLTIDPLIKSVPIPGADPGDEEPDTVELTMIYPDSPNEVNPRPTLFTYNEDYTANVVFTAVEYLPPPPPATGDNKVELRSTVVLEPTKPLRPGEVGHFACKAYFPVEIERDVNQNVTAIYTATTTVVTVTAQVTATTASGTYSNTASESAKT